MSSFKTTLQSPILGAIAIQVYPNTTSGDGFSIYCQTQASFTVNRIAFEQAELYFVVNQDGSGLRHMLGLRTHLPGRVGAVSTTESSREKIYAAMEHVMEAFAAGADFKAALREADRLAREALAYRISANVDALQKKIFELRELHQAALDSTISFHVTNKKHENATRNVL